jgi:large subunit ribosomal protein L13
VSTDTAKAETKKSEKTKEAKAAKKAAAKSESAKSEKKSTRVEKSWHVIDAEGKVLGKLAVQVANLLRGKHKPAFTTYTDCGDHVIVINAEKIKVTGKKEEQKLYRSHSGYPHGFKEEILRSLRRRRPTEVVEKAIWGMIPHTRLGAKQFTKLKVYAGAEHPHEAQSPAVYEITRAS